MSVKNRNALDLSQSLRTHLAGDVSTFANALISGEIEKAKTYSAHVKFAGFPMYVTRDLDMAKNYLRQRYKEEPTKRYGMISSSKGNVLRRHGMDNSFTGSVGIFYAGKWFNANANDSRSCCALTSVATEFSCQGLEIDMPLIGWDSDMLWDGTQWKKFKAAEPNDSEANVYRKNSYRVLLTRGRDGFIIYVPDDPVLDDVYALYTTNIIEGLNRQFRQITKNKPSFTNDDSLRKMLYLASQRIVKRWTQRCRNWDLVLGQLSLMFEDRITA